MNARQPRFGLLISLISICALVLFLPDLAMADHRALIGIGSCEGERSLVSPSGEVVELEACLTRSGAPLEDHLIAFVVAGPSSTSAREVRTDSRGRARIAVSSSSEGHTRVGVCDDAQCFDPVVITWSNRPSPAPEVGPSPPQVMPSSPDVVVLVPRLNLPTAPSGQGFVCEEGPRSAAREVPAFVSIENWSRAEVLHPSTRRDADAVTLVTGQNVLSGAAIYDRPALTYLSMAASGPVDPGSSFPYRSFNRQLVIWTIDGVHWGKQEFAFERGSWRERSPRFTAVIKHEQVTFISDSSNFPSRIAVGTRVAGLCDGDGFLSENEIRSVLARQGEATPQKVALGIGLLVLIGALAVAVMGSTEPPPGISAQSPGIHAIRYQRGDIRYDDFARPIGYVDILELPDGTTRTVRTRIRQEELLLRGVDFLDSTDWEDPVFEIEREGIRLDSGGRVAAYNETTRLHDGTVYHAEVTDVVYDSISRVTGYSRTTRVGARGGMSDPRLEVVELLHEDQPASIPTATSSLVAGERVERADIRLDKEGHVSGYVSSVRTQGEGEVVQPPGSKRFRPAVPRAVYEIGGSLGETPLFESQPILGLARARRVLIRWFRRHGCKVDISLSHPGGEPIGNVEFHFGKTPARTDHRGRQTMWALEEGFYSVTVGTDDLIEPVTPLVPKIVGWVHVAHIPGSVKAAFEVEPVSISIPTH